MPWIRQIGDREARGLLKKLFDEARQRAGKIWNVVRLMSLRPKQLQVSMELYREVMFGESGLTRAERELVAVIVSATNHCVYWMLAHGHDLRAEVADKSRVPGIVREWRSAALSPREHALGEFAEKLTRSPGHMRESDLAPLRAAGLDDPAITDLVQVVAYFNYINRVADALGIDPEPGLEEG